MSEEIEIGQVRRCRHTESLYTVVSYRPKELDWGISFHCSGGGSMPYIDDWHPAESLLLDQLITPAPKPAPVPVEAGQVRLCDVGDLGGFKFRVLSQDALTGDWQCERPFDGLIFVLSPEQALESELVTPAPAEPARPQVPETHCTRPGCGRLRVRGGTTCIAHAPPVVEDPHARCTPARHCGRALSCPAAAAVADDETVSNRRFRDGGGNLEAWRRMQSNDPSVWNPWKAKLARAERELAAARRRRRG